MYDVWRKQEEQAMQLSGGSRESDRVSKKGLQAFTQ